MRFQKGYIPWNKGRRGDRYSLEHREKIREAKLGSLNPMWGKQRTQWAIEQTVKALTGRHVSCKTRQKLSLANAGHRPTVATRQKMSAAKMGYVPWNKGKTGIYSEEWRKQRSRISKELWQNPDFIRKQMMSRHVAPNKAEKQLNELLNHLCPGEYKYVGCGEVILAGKCPDFINVNGKKKIIELYGEFWHTKEEEKNRIALFSKYGYNTMIIWSKEMMDRPSLSSRILDFNGGPGQEINSKTGEIYQWEN